MGWFRSYRTLKRELRKAQAELIETQRELRECQELNMSLFNGRYQSPQKSDGTVNSGGKVYFYETGTSTLKSVYTDEALTTAHTNPVILDSAGSALVFLGTGSYDYKVDDSADAAVVTTQGPITSEGDGRIISTAVDWTVDGIGGTSATFATVTLAMVSARTKTIMGGGGLTITVNDDTYINDAADYTHPQGQYITIIGQSQAGTILSYTSGDKPVNITNGGQLGAIKNLTIQTNVGSGNAIYVDNGGHIGEVSTVTLAHTGTSTASSVYVDNATIGDLSVISTGFFTLLLCLNTGRVSGNFGVGTTFLKSGVRATTLGKVNLVAFHATTTSATPAAALWTEEGGAINCATFSISNANAMTNAIHAEDFSRILVMGTFECTNATTGVKAVSGGVVYLLDATPTFTTVTTNYNPTENLRVNQNTSTASAENVTFIGQA